ncbi:hypothetical protein pipiens_009359 [Culex pipiens pipiens]|uniref:Transmembrane protein 129 n=1 Tax=Culex pipiens pipiens TaxID=38569 RepID=A0ABD1DER7_CULPP
MSQESAIVFTIFYALLCFCIVYPSTEFVSAGLTVDHVFSSTLGSESLQFVQHHIRRTSLNLMVHSLLPVMYIRVYFMQFGDDGGGRGVGLGNFRWWQLLGSRVVIRMNPLSRIVVTESWIVKTGPYWINVAGQEDTALVAFKSDTHDVSQEAFETVQYVNIAVKSTRPGIREFNIRINALDFKDLQDRINRPITILSSVKFHRTVLDRFVDVFKEQVGQNPRYRGAEAVDQQDSCFACMQVQPNVKIVKNCADLNEDGEPLAEARCCQPCNCRPMWCIDCVARWFASRQNQSERESWLQQKCTCPMCRARFCVLDVCFIEAAR